MFFPAVLACYHVTAAFCATSSRPLFYRYFFFTPLRRCSLIRPGHPQHHSSPRDETDQGQARKKKGVALRLGNGSDRNDLPCVIDAACLG